jgi:hypothetical protein
MILAYKTELDDSKLERKQLQNIILDLVGKYERLAAQVVEAMHDISSHLQAQTRRLDVLNGDADEYQGSTGAGTESSRAEGPGPEDGWPQV